VLNSQYLVNDHKVKHKINVNTLGKELSPSLQLNEIGQCEVTLDQVICFDSYKINQGTGSFIIIDRLTNVTIGAGMIVDVLLLSLCFNEDDSNMLSACLLRGCQCAA
jgi:sulfate adenylyltransferase subunit 1 (EFTu-like GTPase family)